jgi:VWFA-related protein
VKNQSGELVEGLLPQDFSVMEDGARQKISFFTSDPFPLSAALVIDVGMSDTELKKVQNTLSALAGSFGPFDDVSIYTYANTVKKIQDLSGANSQAFSEALRKLKKRKGDNPGPPVLGGPMQSGPTVNSKSTDPTAMGPVYMPNYHPESHVLNDAILRAAVDLSKEDCVAPTPASKTGNAVNQCPTRRKILFVISTGEERGSANSYQDVMKVLLSNQIAVYAIGVGSSAMPVYGKLTKFHIPGLGYGDILPKYASATGGQLFPEFSQDAIESAYARVTEEARNQYTVGYYAPAAGISNQYRTIEVLVKGSSAWKVYAKDGYYPLPAPIR